jgi:hypothetical protein
MVGLALNFFRYGNSSRFLLLGLGVVAALGCGDGRPSRVPISGQVTIDGKPLAFGSVLFRPKNGRAAGGSLDANGRYVLSCFAKGDGAIVGEYSVGISGNEQLGETSQRWHAPKKYSDPATSGLTATVDEPRDDLNFDLKWDGGKPFVEKF